MEALLKKKGYKDMLSKYIKTEDSPTASALKKNLLELATLIDWDNTKIIPGD